MKKVSDFFKIASGVFAVIPGIAILISDIGVPPNTSKALFAGTIEGLGVFSIMLLWINRATIKKLRLETINKVSVFCILLFLLSLFCYLFLYGFFVEEVQNSQPVLFPLWANGELKKGLESIGTRAELINQWGRDDVYKVIQGSSKTALLITTLLFLFVYQLVFISLTVSFGILGIKKS